MASPDLRGARERFESRGTRLLLDLDGPWTLAFDDADAGIAESWFRGLPVEREAEALQIEVPSIWQRYRDVHGGIGWYFRTVELPEAACSGSLRLRIGAADYRARVWWNGQFVGEHDGGFTPFELAVESVATPGPNRLVVRVSDVGRGYDPEYTGLPGWDQPTIERIDGLSFAEIPVGHQDWKEGFDFSGIWQHVELIATDSCFVDDVFVLPDLRSGSVEVQAEIHNNGLYRGPATVEVSVAPWRDTETVSGQIVSAISLKPGPNLVNCRVVIEGARAWSPEDPFLYSATVGLRVDGRLIDDFTTRFGLREFTVGADGYFELNGERIFVKGAHYQSTEPETLAYPRDIRMARRIVELAKEGGFNFMRLQLRPTAPAILDAADELGILCMSEPPLSKMVDNARSDALALREIREQVRRDRNRPSIALWNMVNEQAAAMRVVHEMCLAARELDPTRLITESCGGPSHYYLPHSTLGVSYLGEHWFHGQPVAEALIPYALDRGVADRLFFVTEFAFTGLADDDSVISAFGPNPVEHAEDYRGFLRHRRELQDTFEHTDLGDVFPSLADFRAATQTFQANNVRLLVGAMRANPRLGGYNIVQLADSNANELSGLVDFWRDHKKRAFTAIQELNRPLQLLVHSVPFNPIRGGTLRVAVTLVNEHVIQGQLRLAVRVVGPSGVWFESDHVVDAAPWVTRLLDTAVPVGSGSGAVETTAELWDGERLVVRGASVSTAYDPADEPWPDRGFAVFDPQSRWQDWLGHPEWRARPYRPGTERADLVLVPAFESLWRDESAYRAFVDLVHEVRRGSRILFLGVPQDGLPPGSRRIDLIDAFHPFAAAAVLGFEFHRSAPSPWSGMVGGPYAWSVGETDAGGVITSHPAFAGLPGPGLLDYEYSNVVPKYRMPIRRQTIENSGRGVRVVPLGSGRVAFCLFELLPHLGKDGLAGRLLANLVRHYASDLPDGLRGLSPQEEEDRRFLELDLTECWRELPEPTAH